MHFVLSEKYLTSIFLKTRPDKSESTPVRDFGDTLYNDTEKEKEEERELRKKIERKIRRSHELVAVSGFTYKDWLHACAYIKRTAISLSTRTSPRWLSRIL